MYYITIDDISSLEMGLKVTRRPSIPAPVKNFKEYDILGRNGKLYEDLETYDDIIIEIEMNYISNPNLWHQKWREVKRWILKKGLRKLGLSDNPDFYFLIKKIQLGTNEREIILSGEFTISLTLECYQYMRTGAIEYNYKDVMENPLDRTQPIYKIKGEGLCILTVNGTECHCNVGQNLIIDTFRYLSYREDGVLQNTSINADYEDLELLEGYNDISITEGFELKIIPNWRCL